MSFRVISQPGVFFRRSAWERAGGLDLTYHYLLDHHLWLRMTAGGKFDYLPEPLAAARFHAAAKNRAHTEDFGKEAYRLADWLLTDPLTFLVLLLAYAVIVLGTKYVSLASVMCAFLYPLLLSAFSKINPANAGFPVTMAVLSTVLVIFMHRENLKRLWNGQESKVSFSKKSKKKKDGSEESGKDGNA